MTEEVRPKANPSERHAALFVNVHPVEILKTTQKQKKTEDVDVATDSLKLLRAWTEASSSFPALLLICFWFFAVFHYLSYEG